MAESTSPTTSPSPASPPVEDPLPPSASLAPSAPSLEDWPKQATDAVVKVVDAVRDKTTGPAVSAAHAAKYGIVVALVAFILFVLFLIMLIRGTEAIFQMIATKWDITWLADPIWIVYLLYGSIFSLAGLFMWRKANKPAKA